MITISLGEFYGMMALWLLIGICLSWLWWAIVSVRQGK